MQLTRYYSLVSVNRAAGKPELPPTQMWQIKAAKDLEEGQIVDLQVREVGNLYEIWSVSNLRGPKLLAKYSKKGRAYDAIRVINHLAGVGVS